MGPGTRASLSCMKSALVGDEVCVGGGSGASGSPMQSVLCQTRTGERRGTTPCGRIIAAKCGPVLRSKQKRKAWRGSKGGGMA